MEKMAARKKELLLVALVAIGVSLYLLSGFIAVPPSSTTTTAFITPSNNTTVTTMVATTSIPPTVLIANATLRMAAAFQMSTAYLPSSATYSQVKSSEVVAAETISSGLVGLANKFVSSLSSSSAVSGDDVPISASSVAYLFSSEADAVRAYSVLKGQHSGSTAFSFSQAVNNTYSILPNQSAGYAVPLTASNHKQFSILFQFRNMVATVSVNESSASTRTTVVTDMAERLLINAFPYLVNYHSMNLLFPNSTVVSYAANGSATGTSNTDEFMLMSSRGTKMPVIFRSELFPAAYLPDIAPTKLKVLQTLVYPIIPVFREYLGLADEPSLLLYGGTNLSTLRIFTGTSQWTIYTNGTEFRVANGTYSIHTFAYASDSAASAAGLTESEASPLFPQKYAPYLANITIRYGSDALGGGGSWWYTGHSNDTFTSANVPAGFVKFGD